ncbi:MAG: 30S ribosome-binding factor RbfA [Syntrophales bacterium]
MNLRRSDRVADLIKAELSDIILRQIRDPRIGTVTITGVKLTDDLRSARVYFVRMGQDTNTGDIREALQKAAGFLKKELGARLRLRYIPSITFVYDKSFEYGSRIEKLLDEVKSRDTESDGEENH